MGKNTVSKISNAFSTGGGGVNFEQQIQAMFLLSLLIDGFCPAMNEQTKRVCFQTKHLGHDVDDIAVITDRGHSEGKLLCQVKHAVTATEKDRTFKEVVCAAWSDINKEDFDVDRDRIALATAQIANKSQQSLRFLHDQAVGSVDEKEFIERVNTPVYSSANNKNMLNTIGCCISESKGSEANQNDIWRFCKAFILLLFDMDCKESVNRALSYALVKCNSNRDAIGVWAKLVEYAGECNQSAATIDLGNIDCRIRELFKENKVKYVIPDPIKEIDLFIPTIALIGSWDEENEHDCRIVEIISGVTYAEFEAKARGMLSQNTNYLELYNGNTWRVLHKEELLSQCKDMLFDNCLSRLFEAVKLTLSQKSKRATSQTSFYTLSREYDNSSELRSNLVDSICWVKKMLPELPSCNHDKVEMAAAQLVRLLLDKAEWSTWVSLRDCLKNLAELSPDVFLDSVEQSVSHTPQEILRLFPTKGSGLFHTSNYVSELLWALEIVAWSPDYLIRSICTLGLLEALPYERTNWANTPINSIVSILLPWYPQTMASIEKRKNALRCLKNDNPDIFWRILKKLLPNQTTSTSDNPKPQYLSISIPEEITISNAEVQECYGYLLELAVETVCNEQEKIVDLIDQIEYMYEPTLSNYLSCIENTIVSITNEYSFELWLKLRERRALIKPTEGTVIYKQLERIDYLIKILEPRDIRLRYRELYLGKRHCFVQNEYLTHWEMLEHEKNIAVREIFDQYGIEETERFGKSVNNLQDVACKLGQSMTQNEITLVIDACSSNLVSEAFAASCIKGFIYNSGADELLKTSLKSVNKELASNLLSRIPFTMQLLKVIDEVLPDTSLYWEKACMPYACREEDSDQLTLIVDKLISCKRYVTAVNIVGRSKWESIFEAEYISNLLRLAGTEDSYGNESLDDYAVQKVIGWMQKQKNIDLEIRSDIEFIYLPFLDSTSGVRPLALNTRLSLWPDYFCSMIELFYKKSTEKKHEMEINKGLNERLFKILFQFKVAPGIDENGCFNETEFKSWMNYVKKWSKENDRYEVTMHTVGSGLSYALLDEEKMPTEAIVEELNRAENEELRRGYYLGVINQRGVHFIDPEGKPELELAEEYRGRANIAEEKGYSRYAGVLNEVAEQYYREARHNIAAASKIQ